MVVKNEKKVDAGRRWSKAGTHTEFATADDERKVLLNDTTLQVKVRRRHARGEYTVHYRKNPNLVADKSSKKKNKKEKRGKKKASQKKVENASS